MAKKIQSNVCSDTFISKSLLFSSLRNLRLPHAEVAKWRSKHRSAVTSGASLVDFLTRCSALGSRVTGVGRLQTSGLLDIT